MAAAVKYVRQRNGVYLYERRVPLHVQQQAAHYAVHFHSRPLFRRSLRTKDQVEMMKACLPVHLEFERKLAAVKGSGSPSTSHVSPNSIPILRNVTQADLDALSERYRQLEVGPFERAHILADTSPAHAEEYDRMLYNLEQDAEEAQNALSARGAFNSRFETPAEIAAWVIQNEGWDAPAGSLAFGAITGAIRAGIQKGRTEAQALLMGNAVPRLPDSPKGSSSVPTLSEAVESYLKQRDLPVRTATEVKSSLRLFVGVIGNKRLDALTPRDFKAYAEHLASQTIGGKTAGSVVRPASRATLKKRIGLLRAAINHAIQTDRFSGPNPAGGINVDAYAARSNRAIMPEKRRFKVDEMNLIFKHPWFTGCASPSQTHKPGNYRLTGSEYWVPVVAAYTGCRASELGGLMMDEVLLDSAHPHLVIRDNKWRRTKKGEARDVPVLDALMELGFADYVERVWRSGAERLFPDWEAPNGKDSDRNDDKQWSNGKIIRAFNRTVIRQMLGHQLATGARLEVTFHGFRGAFKAMLGHSDYKVHPNIIHEVLGHEKGGMDTVYVGTISIEETYPAIRRCRHKGLFIPPLG